MDARFARPIDRDLLAARVAGTQLLVTLEESVLPGGFGSAVLETLADNAEPDADLPPIKRIGIPDGSFVDHGSVSDLRHLVRLDAEGIRAQIDEAIEAFDLAPAASPAAAPATVEV